MEEVLISMILQVIPLVLVIKKMEKFSYFVQRFSLGDVMPLLQMDKWQPHPMFLDLRVSDMTQFAQMEQ